MAKSARNDSSTSEMGSSRAATALAGFLAGSISVLIVCTGVLYYVGQFLDVFGRL